MTLGVLAAVAASSSSVNDVEPGVIAFLIVAAMGVALVFLLRSMNKQFRKITPAPGGDEAGDLDQTHQDQTRPDQTHPAQTPK